MEGNSRGRGIYPISRFGTELEALPSLSQRPAVPPFAPSTYLTRGPLVRVASSFPSPYPAQCVKADPFLPGTVSSFLPHPFCWLLFCLIHLAQLSGSPTKRHPLRSAPLSFLLSVPSPHSGLCSGCAVRAYLPSRHMHRILGLGTTSFLRTGRKTCSGLLSQVLTLT